MRVQRGFVTLVAKTFRQYPQRCQTRLLAAAEISDRAKNHYHTFLSRLFNSSFYTLFTRPYPYRRPQFLSQRLAPNHQRLTRLQHKYHAAPLCLARVPPRMHSSTLHAHIASSQPPRLARIEHTLNRTLQHNPIIQAHCSVHRTRHARREIDVP